MRGAERRLRRHNVWLGDRGASQTAFLDRLEQIPAADAIALRSGFTDRAQDSDGISLAR